jgi:hypothetical protein
MTNNPLVLIIGRDQISKYFIFLVFYRSAQKYRADNTDYRTLSKIYGLRFVIAITGKGGQFNIVNLFVAIGRRDLLYRFLFEDFVFC